MCISQNVSFRGLFHLFTFDCSRFSVFHLAQTLSEIIIGIPVICFNFAEWLKGKVYIILIIFIQRSVGALIYQLLRSVRQANTGTFSHFSQRGQWTRNHRHH